MNEMLNRFDFAVIARWIQHGEHVLDLGCGDGSLLQLLTQTRHIHGYGIDNDPHNLIAALRQGINVLQLDLEKGLADIQDNAFDHVIMSLSLQTVRHTVPLVKEMLRVGHEAVVSFPNFGHRSHRQAIAQGRMPVSEALPYQWFDSPNVRFFTIADFEALCQNNAIRIIEALYFDEGQTITHDPNLNADVALYRLGRNTASPQPAP